MLLRALNSRPSALSYALILLADALPEDESTRALALLDDAVEVGAKLGDRRLVANATIYRGLIAVRRSEWRTALRASVDAADQYFELGETVPGGGPFWNSIFALAALGRLEPAAVLLGIAQAFAGWTGSDSFTERLATTAAALREGLGAQQVANMIERGAAMDLADAITYLRVEANRALNT